MNEGIRHSTACQELMYCTFTYIYPSKQPVRSGTDDDNYSILTRTVAPALPRETAVKRRADAYVIRCFARLLQPVM